MYLFSTFKHSSKAKLDSEKEIESDISGRQLILAIVKFLGFDIFKYKEMTEAGEVLAAAYRIKLLMQTEWEKLTFDSLFYRIFSCISLFASGLFRTNRQALSFNFNNVSYSGEFFLSNVNYDHHDSAIKTETIDERLIENIFYSNSFVGVVVSDYFQHLPAVDSKSKLFWMCFTLFKKSYVVEDHEVNYSYSPRNVLYQFQSIHNPDELIYRHLVSDALFPIFM
jgi:hypothetical protein